MFKSVLGVAIANFAIINIVALNNTGQGWEVPVDTITSITRYSFLLFAAVLFALIWFSISYKQFLKSSFLFKIIYLISVIICLLSISFLFYVKAFQGQFWNQGFSTTTFFALTISFGFTLFIISVLSLYKVIPENKN